MKSRAESGAKRPAGPQLETALEIGRDLRGFEVEGGVVDEGFELNDGAAAAPQAGVGGVGERGVGDDDGQYRGTAFGDDEADAGLEGQEMTGWAFESALGEDTHDVVGGEGADGLAGGERIFGVGADGDNAAEVPEALVTREHHAAVHHPADEVIVAGLDEDGVYA